MRVKKYRAASLPDALRAVKRDLGADAVIVHSQRVQRGGILGLFGQEAVEVVAAVDNAIRSGTAEGRPHPEVPPAPEGTHQGDLNLGERAFAPDPRTARGDGRVGASATRRDEAVEAGAAA